MKIALCITGASGALYAKRALAWLSAQARHTANPPEVHWVASSNAPQVWKTELNEDMPSCVEGTTRWSKDDFSAPFASGSNAPDAVVVMPCSMSTLARVAHGGGTDLIARSCEVALKERRKLILVARETPLSLVHLRNMCAATEAGATILPAVPSFYGGQKTLEEAVDTVLARVFDHAGFEHRLVPRWGEA